MTAQQWIGLAAGAVLFFWMIGAYNRLVSLRTAIGDAVRQIDELVQRRGAATAALTATLVAPMAAEQGALDAWGAASADVQRACAALRARPVMAALAVALVNAEAAAGAAGSRVLALLEQHPEALA